MEKRAKITWQKIKFTSESDFAVCFLRIRGTRQPQITDGWQTRGLCTYVGTDEMKRGGMHFAVGRYEVWITEREKK